MNTEKTFADRLKELRNIRNYTQEELGKITNISVQSIRRYEQGRLNEEPSAYNLLQSVSRQNMVRVVQAGRLTVWACTGMTHFTVRDFVSNGKIKMEK